ncbi:MAG: hypothetical protein HZB18_10765 [Chloroflexi bacterium]|nr:hypothetical protein [Chloroflexota bacterium]
MQPIPLSLSPFFQEYDFSKLNPQKDSFTIIERVLQFGNRSEIRWLFLVYSQEKISSWVKRWGKEILPEPHRTFWRLVLDISE